MAMSQEDLRRRWEAKHGHSSGAQLATKGAAMSATFYDGGVSHLTPAQQAQVTAYKATHYAPPICDPCRIRYADGNAVNGECEHGPRRTAERLAFQRKARAMNLAQELAAGHLGTGSVRVVDVGQAVTEDATRATWHAIIDQLFI